MAGAIGRHGQIAAENVMEASSSKKENATIRGKKSKRLKLFIKKNIRLNTLQKQSPSNNGVYCSGERRKYRTCNTHVYILLIIRFD